MRDNSLCILVRRAPYGQIHAAEALRHASGALSEGLVVSLLLSGDGVYVARDGQNMGDSGFTALSPVLRTLLAKGVNVYAHGPSAQMRGLLDAGQVVPGVQVADDDQVASLLAQTGAVMVY